MDFCVLDENIRKNIIFDVIDGIPPSTQDCPEALEFRKEIEISNKNLEYRAEELGIDNPLFEFASQG